MTPRPIYLVSITPTDDPDVVHLPLLSTVWLTPDMDLSQTQGIILTSKNGIEALERIAPEWKKLPVVCVGKATQTRAEAAGAKILAAADGYGNELYTLILERFADKKWLYARPKVVASDFANRLNQAGVAVTEAIVYETVCTADDIDTRIDDDAVLIFTSPSALHCFTRHFTLLPSHAVVAIGRTTRKALNGHTVHLAAEPTVHSCITLAKQLAKERT